MIFALGLGLCRAPALYVGVHFPRGQRHDRFSGRRARGEGSSALIGRELIALRCLAGLGTVEHFTRHFALSSLVRLASRLTRTARSVRRPRPGCSGGALAEVLGSVAKLGTPSDPS